MAKRFSIQAFMPGGLQSKATTAASTAELLSNVSGWEQRGCLWFTASDGAEEQVTGHTGFDDLPLQLVWRVAGQKRTSQGSQGGQRSAQGSPTSTQQVTTSSIAFGKSAKLLQHYCPLIKMIKVPQGVDDLQGVSGITIHPESFNIPREVLEYLVPRLKIFLLQKDIGSTNEASKVLQLFQVIKVLLRCRPLPPAVVPTAQATTTKELQPAPATTAEELQPAQAAPSEQLQPAQAAPAEQLQPAQAAPAEELWPAQAIAVQPPSAGPQLTASWPRLVQLEECESERLEVLGSEATSHRFVTQQVSHEVPHRVPGVVKGRVELQIKCTRSDKSNYLMGACEVAANLSTSELLNKKLQQVAKEALAIAVKNASQEVGMSSQPIKMLLADGRRFMRVDFKLETDYEDKMDISKLKGSFEFSAAYPLIYEPGVRMEDVYNGVRLLVSWLWDAPYNKLTKDMLSEAWQAAEDGDAALVADDDKRLNGETSIWQKNQKLTQRAAKRPKAG